ncbi:MAG: ComEA family DNA-binding protein [Bacteroidetes bacterium]|jgi:competence protein ComEA|nr:ComEA family DNA-binding protein [Bacteroidota bacterium]
MLRGLADRLALTSIERRAITILVGTFIVGLGVRLWQVTFAYPPKFDYSASDSAFTALSAEVPAPYAAPETTAAVNLNTASKERLMSLPGIGPATAERIMLERDDGGPFRTVDDLRRVRGIGTKRIEQLRPLVTVD